MPVEPFPPPSAPFAPRTIATFNEHVRQRPWIRRLPRRRAWTLWLTREGRCRFEPSDGSAPLDVPEGRVLLTHPGPHGRGRMQVPPGARARSLTFDVIPRDLISPVFGWGPAPGAPTQPSPEDLWGVTLPRLLAPRWTAPAALLIMEACDRWYLQGTNLAVVDLRLASWLADYSRSLIQQKLDGADDDDPAIAAAETHARRTYPGGCTTADMAAAAGLSRSQFAERYRQARGEGPGTFLRRLRLDEARRLLAHTDLTIERIARKCGYRSTPTFARSFRTAEGLAPAAWRAARRQ